MADIAQLGIAVDTSQTKLAARELENLAAAGAKAEGSTKKLGSTSKQAMEQAAAATAKAQQTMERMLAAQERQEKLMEQMAREMQQLNQALQGNASANNAAAQAAQNAAQALGQESAAAKSAQAAAQGHAQAATSAAAASGAMGAQATATGGALGGMASKVLATATAVLSLGKIISEMDAWTNMNNRIRLVTEGQEQFATAQANIISIAKSTNQPLAETAELYQRLAMNQKTLGLSGTELSGIVKTISQTMVISGSSAAGGAAALMQLGQAFNSGVLRGEEFNSVMEQAPGLMQAIAAGMGKTVGEMRALAEAGKITTDELVKALQKQAATVDADYGKMSKTVEQSMTNVKTAFTEFVGRADEATGVSKALSTAINGVAANIGPLATIAATLVGVGLATWIGSAAAASGGLAVALGGVASASTGLLAAMGPAGWLILGVGAAATAWQLLGSKASTAGAQMSSAGEQAAAAGNKLVAGIVPAINTAIGAYDKMIAKQKESMGIAKTPIDDAAKALKEADLNLQKLAQQVARAQQGSGEYVNMGPKQRAAAEKALTDELEKASKKRGEFAAKEAEYNSNVVAQYVKGKERQTDASAKLLAIEEAKEKRDKALAAAGYDRARQEQVNSAYRVELAKIEESSSKKAASAVSAATRETNKALKEQNNAYADLAGVSSTYYKEMEGYQAQRAKGNITEAQYVELVEKLIQKQPFAVALTKAQTEAFKEQEDARKKASAEIEKAYQKEVDAAQKSAKAAQEKVGQLSDEAKAIEISKAKHITLAEAMEEVIVKRLEDQLESAKQAGNQELLDAIADEIKARKELGKALGDREVREAADDAAKDASKSWQDTAKKINGDLTDAIIAGFEGGKNGAQALKDSLVKMFKDMVLRPVISAIVAPVSGMLATGAQAAGGAAAGGGGIGSIGSSISTAISNGFSSFAMSSIGQKLGLSSVGADGMGPPSLSSTGQGMSTAMGVIGDTLAGYAMGSMARSLISGGYSVSKGMDTFQKVGVAVGSALGGPVMGAIIGAAAGVFNRAFGRKLADLGVEAKFGGEQNFSGNQYKFEKGGWFRSDKTTRDPMSQEMADAFEERFNGIRVSMGFMATTLGVSADSVAEFTRDVKLSFMGLDADQVVEKIDEMFANMSDDMAASILGVSQTTTTTVKEMQTVVTGSGDDMVTSFIEVEKQVTQTIKAQSEYAKSGETHTQTLMRLSSSLITVNGVFDTLGTTMYEASLKGGDMASKLVDLFGGEDKFSALAGSYYDAYYTEQEKESTLRRQTTEALAEHNLAMPATREAYRKLVEAQELTTESGRKNYAVLLKNAGAFAELTPAAEAANRQIAGINKLFHGLSIDGKLVETKFTKATEEIFDSLGVSVQEYSSSIGGVISGILTGTTKAEDAGAALANAAVGGINNAIAQAASDAIAAQFVNAVITPILANIQSGRAALEGVDVKGAIAKANQDALDVKTVLNTIGVELGSGIEGMAAALVGGSDIALVQTGSIWNQADRASFEQPWKDLVRGITSQVKQSLAELADLNAPILRESASAAEKIAQSMKEQFAALGGDKYQSSLNEQIGIYSAESARAALLESQSNAPGVSPEDADSLVRQMNIASQNAYGALLKIWEFEGAIKDITSAVEDWAKGQRKINAYEELTAMRVETASTASQIESMKLDSGSVAAKITEQAEKRRKEILESGYGQDLRLQMEPINAEIERLQGLLSSQQRPEEVGYAQQQYDLLGRQLEFELKKLEGLNSELSDISKIIDDWEKTQKELRATELMIDIGAQIKELEKSTVGPLTSIKEKSDEYRTSLEELGFATEENISQLDKLTGMQLDQARTGLYDQLLSEEERRAKEQEKLNSAFTELGATTPASTDALRAMIDAARDAGNVGLADSLLELVPAFVALQGAADGAGSALDRAMQDVDKAFAALQRSINAEKDRINADAQAQIDAINAGAEAREKAIDDARQQVQDLGSIFDDITKAVKTLRGNAQDEAMQMEQARAYISMALSVAQAGGTVDRENLREAMGTVTKDNAQSYITGADYRFAQARQAAELQALADITGEQKDVAQATLDAALEANKAAQEQIDAIIEARDKQLKALDDQLKAAQEQIDVMRGVDISVLGVGDAVIAFDTAMATYQSEKSRIDAENLALQAAIDEKIKQQKDQDLEICIMQIDAINGVQIAINGMANTIASAIAGAVDPVAPSVGPVITYDGDQGPGLYVNGGLTGGVMPKFPSFDVGTNYVPNDMIAQIHEGEAIVPKEFNPAAFGGVKTDDAQLASLVVSLTTEVQRLQTIVKAGNDEQRRTADAVNGRPEAPMLVETV